MCKKYGDTKLVRVKISSDLSCDEKDKWKDAQIDACIADIVNALQKGGIDMRGSCCGHGLRDGEINLQDGRTLIIKHKETYCPNDAIIDLTSLSCFLRDKGIKYYLRLAQEIKELKPIRIRRNWE